MITKLILEGMKLKHSTSKKNISKILKNGFELKDAPLGKAVYFQPLEGIHSYGKDFEILIVELKNDVNLFEKYNNEKGIEDLLELRDSIGRTNIRDYFLKLGFDGINLLNDKFEPQVILFNIKKIKNISRY